MAKAIMLVVAMATTSHNGPDMTLMLGPPSAHEAGRGSVGERGIAVVAQNPGRWSRRNVEVLHDRSGRKCGEPG